MREPFRTLRPDLNTDPNHDPLGPEGRAEARRRFEPKPGGGAQLIQPVPGTPAAFLTAAACLRQAADLIEAGRLDPAGPFLRAATILLDGEVTS